jgi:hypothetical protein
MFMPDQWLHLSNILSVIYFSSDNII